MSVIDIVIPVYRGLAETRACLESVLSARNAQIAEVVVVDDASPEPTIVQYLDALAAAGRIALIRNEANRGFVASVNRGMTRNGERDLILLNSDTEVADGWLDRLVACAKAHPDAASLSPFSNNATLCSYPRIARSNALPAGWSVAALDALFAQTNAGRSVELPTTVGFCMYLRRAALNAIGPFDEQAFGRGYGEENDWCLRASAQGWKHRLCGDVFVYHRGEVSFAADAAPGKAQAQAVIDERYPDYREQIARHLAIDPARPLRRAVDLARLAASSRPRILFVTHNWGGGTEKHVRDLAALLAEDAEILILRPDASTALNLQWLREGEEFEAWFELPAEEQRMIEFFKSLAFARVHVHHIHRHPKSILALARDLGVPLDVTLHDYFPLSPHYHLSPGAHVPEDDAANAWGLSLTEWRAEMTRFLGEAERRIAPSQDLADRIAPYFPGMRFEVWPHPEAPAMARQRTKVLILGGLTVAKGQDIVLACARDAQSRDLPLFFKVLGHTEQPLPTHPALPLTVYGSYRDEDLADLIALERADVCLFPAQIPESFSYTLTAAMRADLPVVASRLGSFPGRLQGYPRASLVEWNAPAAVWNDALLSLVSPRAIPVDSRQETQDRLRDYVRRYLLPIQNRSAAHPLHLAERHFYTARRLAEDSAKSLEYLYVGGVECGHVLTRDELKRRVVVADVHLVQARQSAEAAHEALRETETRLNILIDELRDDRGMLVGHVKELEAQLSDTQQAYQRVVSSTSWRMTGPLRAGMQFVKDWRYRLSDLRHGLKRLPRDAALAGQILKEEGVVALSRRVHGKLTRRNDFAGSEKHYTQASAIAPLTVPLSETPRWSLIIPVYGQHLMTYTCLKSIADTCEGRAIEVIVVDDCSPEPAAEALAAVSGVRFVRNENNLGFLRNCNKAAASARGEFVVILNNDLILTGDWLLEMTAVFDRHADAGVVGAKLIYPDGRLQEAGGIVWRDGSAWNVGRGDDPDKPEYSYLREVDYCSGACLMLKRDFWNTLGGFDERYAPAYYEDTDLAFRVREAGKRVFMQPHAVVVHFEGQSSGTDVTQGVKRHQVLNQKKFAERWQSVLAKHRPNGLSPQLERDRGARRRVLVVDACMLTPDQDSGSLRMFEMLGIIRRMGCKVSFVADNLEYRLPYVKAIQSLGVEVLHHPYVTSISGLIERQGADFDVVVLSRATTAIKYAELVKAKIPQAKLIFDTVDLHFLRQERQAELSADSAQRRAAENMQKQELAIVAASDVTLVVSPVEQDILEELAPRAHVHVVSNIHVPMPGPVPFADREGVIFIGGFRHPPNLDAITWYVENVLPILRQRQPGLITTVIGSNAPPALQRFAAPDFVVAGFVPDVTPYYQRARISISPLRYGAGVKGKVNLAMQYGVPVVATSPSVEGMHLENDRDVLVADDAAAFADAIIRLHGDEALWNRLRTGGLANIEAWFSRETARRALMPVLDL